MAGSSRVVAATSRSDRRSSWWRPSVGGAGIVLSSASSAVWAGVTAFIVLVGIVSTEAGIRTVQDVWMTAERQSVHARLSTARARLEAEVGSATQIAIGLTNLVSLKPDITQAELSEVADRILPRAKSVINVALAPDNIVRLVHPPTQKSVVGLRYRPGSPQWPAVRTAMARRSIVLDGPHDLHQGGTGLIVRSPVYIRQPGQGTVYWGMVSLVLDDAEVFRNAGIASTALGLHMVAMADRSHAVGMQPLLGDPSIVEENPVRVPVTIPDGVWTLMAVPEEGWSRFTGEVVVARVAGYGFFIAIGAIAFLLALSAQRNERLAHVDALTGLANRRRFTADLKRSCDAALPGSGPHVFVIDLDAFKPVNDLHGHAAGDALLRGIGQRLRDGLPPRCIAGRVGGDEFTVLAPAVVGQPPELFIRRLAALVEVPVHVEGLELSVGCSIGWACHGQDGLDAETLLAVADGRMYAAKDRLRQVETVIGTPAVGRDIVWLDI